MAVEKGQLVHIYSGKIKQLEKTVVVVLVLMLEFVVEVFSRHGRCELALCVQSLNTKHLRKEEGCRGFPLIKNWFC